MIVGCIIIAILLLNYLDIFFHGQLFVIIFDLPIVPSIIIFLLIVLLGIYRHLRKDVKIRVFSNFIDGLQILVISFLSPIFIIRSYKTSLDIFGWFYDHSSKGTMITLSLLMLILSLVFFVSGWELYRSLKSFQKVTQAERLEITE